MPSDTPTRPVGRPVTRADPLDRLERRLIGTSVYSTVKPHLEAVRREVSGGEWYIHKQDLKQK